MSSLGIYFGFKGTDISEAEGKKLIRALQIPISSVADNELDEKVPAEIKLAASFNDTFRRNKIAAKDATLCFSGEDLIIRTFEMPILPREELFNAVTFEAKKYMPFKVEDLISDYQVIFDRKNKTNIVLFMGIKKATFNKYFSILNQLNIKISAIEYSGFSVLRLLKLSGVKEKGIAAVICIDSSGQDEVNFTVLEDGFPLFSRNMNITSLLEETDELSGQAAVLSLEKLRSEIHVSVDYYQRKFFTRPLKNAYVIVNQDLRPQLEPFMAELGLTCKFIDFAKLIGKPVAYSSGFVKSFGASLSKAVNTRVRLNLIDRKVKAEKVEGAAEFNLASLLKGLEFDFRIIAAAIFICAAAWAYGIFRVNPLEQKMKEVIGKKVGVANIDPNASYATLNNTHLSYKKSLANFDNLINKQLYLAEVLNIVSRSLPEGTWLNKFSFGNTDKAELTLEGMVLLKGGDEEFQAVNKFFNNLNSNPAFTKYFNEITTNSIDHAQFQGTGVTAFTIYCRSAKEKK